MSFPHPFSFNDSQPEVRLETFEDLTTARRAVGEVRGFEDPLTTELRNNTMHSLGRSHEEFRPVTYTGDEAKVIVKALKAVASSREDELAVSAADALTRMPLRLRAAAYLSVVLGQESPKPVEDHHTARYPLFAPDANMRPPVVWESKYDNSRKDKRPV